MENVLYYESHVTLEPVFDEKLEQVKVICAGYGFKVADLLFKKRAQDTAERSECDTFCTGRGKTLIGLQALMGMLVAELTLSGYKVWRQKIEAVVYDVRSK